MKLFTAILIGSANAGPLTDMMSQFTNSWFDLFHQAEDFLTGEHPSVLCVQDDIEITYEKCREVAGERYSTVCTALCYDNRDQCVGSTRFQTSMKSCERRICSPNIPVLYDAKCSAACSKAWEHRYKVESDGPHCATDGNKYSSLREFYSQTCESGLDVELEPSCESFRRKMVEYHQTQLEYWQELLQETLATAKSEPIVDQRAVIPSEIQITSVSDSDSTQTEIEKPNCGQCTKTYNPVCAVNDSDEQRSFSDLGCMKATACNDNVSWTLLHNGPCEGDEDFMMDNLSHPIVDDPEFFEQRPLSTLTKISADLILDVDQSSDEAKTGDANGSLSDLVLTP